MKNKEVLIIQDEIVIFQEEHDLILEPGDQVRVLPADEDFGVIDEPYPDEEYEDEFIDEPIIVEEPEIEDEYGVIKPAEGYVGDEPIVDEDDLYDGFDDYEVEEEDDEVLGDHHDVVNIDNVPVDIENDLYDLENSKIVVVHEDVRIELEDQDVILEKGDRIQVLKEDQVLTWGEFVKGNYGYRYLDEFQFHNFSDETAIVSDSNNKILFRFRGTALEMNYKGLMIIIKPDANDIVTLREDVNMGFKVQMKRKNSELVVFWMV